MAKRYVLLFILPLFMLESCNSTVIKYSPIYTPVKRPASCAISLPEHIGVFYEGDVEKEFGSGDKRLLIADFFRFQIKKEISKRTIFEDISLMPVSNTFRRQSTELSTRKGPKGFYLPTENVECHGNFPDIVFILDEIEISSHLDVNVTSGYISNSLGYLPSISSSKDLIITAKFIIWDNQNEDLVSYGFLEIVDENSFAVSRDDWISAVSDFTGKLLEQTPFRKNGF